MRFMRYSFPDGVRPLDRDPTIEAVLLSCRAAPICDLGHSAGARGFLRVIREMLPISEVDGLEEGLMRDKPTPWKLDRPYDPDERAAGRVRSRV